MAEPVILVTCFDADTEWFWPRWALLLKDRGRGKSQLLSIYQGGIHIVEEYHVDNLISASYWARVSEVDKLKASFSGFRSKEQDERLEKMLNVLHASS